MRSSTKVLATLVVLLFGETAMARGGDQSYVSLALTRTEDVAISDGDKSEDVVTILNLSVGVGVGSGLAVGAKYFSYSEDYDSDLTVEIKGYGPMIGYLHQSGFYANYAYLLWPEKVYDVDDDAATYKGGTGHVIDLGKVWDVGSSFGIGIGVSKSDVGYEEVESNGDEADLDGTWSDASLYPYVSFFAFF